MTEATAPHYGRIERQELGEGALTQTQLAGTLGTTRRVIFYYETDAE